MRPEAPTDKRLDTLSEAKTKLFEMLLERSSEVQRVRPYPRESAAGRVILPASWEQQRLWFIDQLEGAGPAYNIPMFIRLRGGLDRQALKKALHALIQRHEVLRTVMVNVNDTPKQEIAPVGSFALREFELADNAEADREERVRAHMKEEASAGFDLGQGPLIRGRLIRVQPAEHVLLITMHHIISDGWSMNIMIEELSKLYAAFREGRSDPLQPLPLQYGDYAQWQQQWLKVKVIEEQLKYWRDRLCDAAPELALPTDRPRPLAQSYRGGTVPIEMDAQLTGALKDLGRRYGMTLFMVLYAGWVILLSRLSGQEDVVIGTPVANRRRRELEGLIGLFVNTLVLRVDARAELPLAQFLVQVKEVTLGAYDHQDTPFEQLVELLRPERSLSQHPIFQVMFVLQNAPYGEVELPELAITFNVTETDTAKFDLLLMLQEQGEGISGTLNYNADIFDRETIERWIQCFSVLLRGMTGGEKTPIGALSILSDVEHKQVTEVFNAAQADYPRGQLVHELFEQQARRTPKAVAVMHGPRLLTFVDLNRKANQLARSLRANGVVPDQPVGICVERSPEMVIGLIAILKAGGAYLPLDPTYPRERLEYMLQDAAPSIVLIQGHVRDILPATQAELIDIDGKLTEVAAYSADDLPRTEVGLSSSNLLYIIYTSGSTGRPKGTAMPHCAMANLLNWHREHLPCVEGERVLQFAALSFDVAFQETFSTLCTGGTLVLVDEWVRRDPQALAELLIRESIERLFVPPMMLASLAEYLTARRIIPRGLKSVITAGEQLRITPDLVEIFKEVRSCSLHNHYGPTETHVATALRLGSIPDEWPTLPSIGRPVANTQIYVLDRLQQPVPVGVAGEIYIGGANLARGYLNRPELTEQRFIKNPFSTDSRSRLYKTGDLGRWRSDGTIEYLGRNDDQVKIRGYRIELGEIEAQLGHHPAVRESVVVAREDAAGDKRLVAYVTPNAGSALSLDVLRTHLKNVVPEHMVPGAFVIMESLPITPSGKLNRRALPPPEVEAFSSEDYERPQGSVEETVARLWKEVLRVEQVGRNENFFELGGHSLLVLKTISKINEAVGANLSVTDMYRSPTVRELAARIREGANDDALVNLAAEATLDENIAPIRGSRSNPPKAVLLTGGTGFCGRFLLAQLMHETDSKIYCLLRATSNQHAASRLRAILTKWDLWREDFERRIVAVPSDLGAPRLGLEASAYQELSSGVDSIYHCGASMNHLETYAMAKPANVESARELLRLATHGRPKLVNYISTLSVFRASADGTARVVDEDSQIDGETHRSANGYMASKWVGEKVFMKAIERGIPCNIFRLGFVWADSQQGRYDELQRGYMILKSALLSGYGIEKFRYHSPPTPVDYVARAIVCLANRYSEGGGVFHISSPGERIESLFEHCNEIGGIELELLPYYEWVCAIKRLHESGWSLPIVPLIESAFSLDEISFYERERRAQSENVPFDCTRTHRELEGAGIVAPVLDEDLLERCITSMLSRDIDVQKCIERMGDIRFVKRGPGSRPPFEMHQSR